MPDPASDKKEAILKTALSLFVERGFFGTPTSLISKEAGVATGTLFFYFKTKEALIDTLYLRVKAEAAEAMGKGIDREPDAKTKLRRVGRNAVTWGIANPEKITFMELFAHSPFVSTSAHEEGMSHFLFLENIIRDGIREGTVQDIDRHLLFCMMASAISAMIGRISTAKTRAEREMVIDQGLDYIWNGLSSEKGGEMRNKKAGKKDMIP